MHWIDTVILLVLVSGALAGALIGFLWQMFWVITLGVGLYCTFLFNPAASAYIHQNWMPNASPFAASATAFVVVFIGVFVIFLFITLTLNRVIKAIHLQWLNRLLGSLFVAGILASALSFIFLLLASFPVSRDLVEQSKIAPALVAGIKSVVAKIPEEYRKPVEEKVEKTWKEQIKPQINNQKKTLKIPLSPQVEAVREPATEIPLADRIIQELSQKKK